MRLSTQTTTLLVMVDLDCRRCYRQIRKVLCKLQATADHERIKTISYDGKGQTISISGPFDPLQLCGKIRCMGGKVIRDIQIKQPPPPPPPPPCPCNRDIERLNLEVAYLHEQQQICADKNRDIEQMKPTIVALQGQQQICEDRNRDVEQLKSNVEELKEKVRIWEGRPNQLNVVHIPSSGCGCNTVHRYPGAPYCGCYRDCQFFREEDTSTGCSVM